MTESAMTNGQTDIMQARSIKTGSITLVDEGNNPVVQFRAGGNNTLQVLDKHGNICTEIHLGQTPGKELSPDRLSE